MMSTPPIDAMVALRREIHAHPEPGFEEYETQARLKRALAELAGIHEGSMRTCAKTGLVIDIECPAPPNMSNQAPSAVVSNGEPPCVKAVALRADMDALRMTERNEALPYRSENEGVAHMCGHDAIMAALVGAAALIARRSARLPPGSCVRLLFQPAEEGPGGAEPMLKEGCLDGVDEVRAARASRCRARGSWRMLERAVAGIRLPQLADDPARRDARQARAAHGARRRVRDRREGQGGPRLAAARGRRCRADCEHAHAGAELTRRS